MKEESKALTFNASLLSSREGVDHIGNFIEIEYP